MKTMPSFPIVAVILLGLAACAPVTTDYTAAEAQKRLTVDDASRSISVFFVPGTARLARGQVARLDHLVAAGEIGPRDRVSVSPAGRPWLAARRTDVIASIMLRNGLTIQPVRLAAVPRDSAVIEIGRYLVTLPDCPDWSKPAAADFTNMNMSNFGCATVSNLGEMVADPADLVSGRPLGLAAGRPAAAAVGRYETDKVQLPTANTALPIAAPSSAAPGAGNNPGS